MSASEARQTKRGFVMTGGGAKGLYEAGVVHAFHLCGMEFDVITGSSIGAINSIFYAEYQYRKRQLPDAVRADPLQAVEALDPYVRAFLHVWWQMPDFRIIDDSDEGPLGQIKDDLLQFDLSLPHIARLGWWWTDPRRSVLAASVWPSIVHLVREGIERLGSGREFLRLWLDSRRNGRPLGATALRAYLERFGVGHALVPDEAAGRLKQFFTQPATPLQTEQLDGRRADSPEGATYTLIEEARTLRDYASEGIDVRLTRTNYRTGRLEVSSYMSARQFVRYLRKHAWRWQRAGDRAVALGSERLYLVGNPRAIDAALASGRFPGVFAPLPIAAIYALEDAADADNQLLRRLLDSWLDDEALKEALLAAYDGEDNLEKRFESWRRSEVLRQLFPHADDAYVDGGTIDNTPANNAIDGIKEWAEQEGVGLNEVTLDLYTVFLHPSPDPGELKLEERPASYQVVQRTLQIRDAAKLASNATTVETINHFGDLAEELGDIAGALADGLRDLCDHLPTDLEGQLQPEQRAALAGALRARLEPWLRQAAGRQGGTVEANLEHVRDAVQRRLEKSLPLRVYPVEIYPDSMPMSTLQFTPRLGFQPANAIAMMTVGCYNTLWELREHLEGKRERDTLDEAALALARRWTGFEEWPGEAAAAQQLRETWTCRRTSCVFHAHHCAHGESPL